MDINNLNESLQVYTSQLTQVEDSLNVTSDENERKSLLELKTDLEQLISLTKESLNTLLDDKEHKNNDLKDDGGNKTELDNEYALFMAEMSKAGAYDDGTSNVSQTTEDCDIDMELSSLIGLKCNVLYEHKWGERRQHQAMVCSLDTSVQSQMDFDHIQVRVLFTHPTHTEMIPCPYYLNGECRFNDVQCRYSHGECVALSTLKDAAEPSYDSLGVGSKVLVKLKPPDDEDISTPTKSTERYLLWHRATIANINAEAKMCTVRLDSSSSSSSASAGSKRKHSCGGDVFSVSIEDILPVTDASQADYDSDSSPSDTEYPECKVPNSDTKHNDLITNNINSGNIGDWEVHTRGIGSKIMLAMGYKAGQGLGKEGVGRVEPVEARILPKRLGLHSQMEGTYKDRGRPAMKVEERLKLMQRKELERTKKLAENAHERERKCVFNFLNNTLGDKSKLTQANKQTNSLGSASSKDLNIQQMKVSEDMRKTEREISKLNESLCRQVRGSESVRNIEARLAERQSELNQMKSKERMISEEQKKRKDNQKLSVF